MRISLEGGGEQLLFKAMTYNQWILVGRKTYEAMGRLPNRKYAVISGSYDEKTGEDICFFKTIDNALRYLSGVTASLLYQGAARSITR
jgi:dihydrofolate reductase (trimethoprim resistance protein)